MLTFEQYDADIIVRAKCFRVMRYSKTGRDELAADSFADARRAAHEATADGYRVLVYAITADDQTTLVSKELWK